MPDATPPTPREERPAPPFFRSMQREMNQFLDRFRGQSFATPAEFFDAVTGPMFPAIDVVETEEAMVITAEVPGVKEEDLDVSIQNSTLVLKGEKSSDREEKEQDYHLVERRYGSFRRQVPLGFTPAEDAVTATFADGVLKLTIAKPEEARQPVRKVEISRA
jgi:HSP20 family protein